MQLRNSKKILRQEEEMPIVAFKRRAIRSSGEVQSEPMQAYTSLAIPAPLVRTNSEEDIEELKRQYVDNPQALQALDEHFKGLKTSSETGMFGSRTEETVYSSYFFRKDIVDNFTKQIMQQIHQDKKSSYPLSSFKLYNADDILENIAQRGTFKTRFTEQSTDYQTLKKNNMDKLIKYLSSKICEDIGLDYVKTAVERAISLTARKNIFDIIVLSSKNIEAMGLTSEMDEESDEEQDAGAGDVSDSEDEDYAPESESESIDSIDEILAYRLSGVVGFIIVELGECKTYPFGYSINLICTNKYAPAGSGSILMGLYLYTILCHPDKTDSTDITFPLGKGMVNIVEKSSTPEDAVSVIETTFTSTEPLTPVQQFGILELASAYRNPGGLCMYEKFGFQYTESMYGSQCFEDFDNLPMLIDFNTKPGYSELSKEQRQQKIINITAGTDKGFPKSKICYVRDSFVNPTGKTIKTGEQKLLGYLKTLKLLMEHDMSSVTGSDAERSIKKLYYTIKFINESKSRTPYEDRAEPSNPGNIDDYINYLETPQANRTTQLDLTQLLQPIPVKGGTKRKYNNRKNKKTKNKKTKSKNTKKLIKRSKKNTKHKR
jgi:hypothetical protein